MNQNQTRGETVTGREGNHRTGTVSNGIVRRARLAALATCLTLTLGTALTPAPVVEAWCPPLPGESWPSWCPSPPPSPSPSTPPSPPKKDDDSRRKPPPLPEKPGTPPTDESVATSPSPSPSPTPAPVTPEPPTVYDGGVVKTVVTNPPPRPVTVDAPVASPKPADVPHVNNPEPVVTPAPESPQNAPQGPSSQPVVEIGEPLGPVYAPEPDSASMATSRTYPATVPVGMPRTGSGGLKDQGRGVWYGIWDWLGQSWYWFSSWWPF